MSTSVLCFSVVPTTGEIFFLLSREASSYPDQQNQAGGGTARGPATITATATATTAVNASKEDALSPLTAHVANDATSSPSAPMLSTEMLRAKTLPCKKKWSDFGGRSEPGEDAFATACRKLFEETCGMLTLGTPEPQPPPDFDTSLSSAMAMTPPSTKPYLLKVVVKVHTYQDIDTVLPVPDVTARTEPSTQLPISTSPPRGPLSSSAFPSNHGGASGTKKHSSAIIMLMDEADPNQVSHHQYEHTTYIKMVPWDPDLPAQFTQVRKALVKVHHLSKELAALEQDGHGDQLSTQAAKEKLLHLLDTPLPFLKSSHLPMPPHKKQGGEHTLADPPTIIWPPPPPSNQKDDNAHQHAKNSEHGNTRMPLRVSMHFLEKDKIQYWSSSHMQQVISYQQQKKMGRPRTGSSSAYCNKLQPIFIPVITFHISRAHTMSVPTRSLNTLSNAMQH